MVISDLLDNIRLLFVSEKKPFLQIKKILGFSPHNIKLYQLALLHKSVAHERYEQKLKQARGKERNELRKERRKEGFRQPAAISHVNNERLEYLGDAILGAIVADILYKHYANKQEGFLTDLRSRLVCRSSLNELSHKIGLDALVKHSGTVNNAHNSFMGGNAFEAFIGAIYLDRGYSYCQRFLESQVFRKYVNIDEVASRPSNFKSALIEWCQKNQFRFRFEQKESRDKESNSPVFHSQVFIEEVPCGTGNGYSKKESDQEAAKHALQKVKKDRSFQAGLKKAKAGKEG